MAHRHGVSRREFIQLSATFGMLAGLGEFKIARAASDYKALVCLFMFGGNDGHNMVVPRGSAEYNAYKAVRGSLALPPTQLLDIVDPLQGAFGLHYAMPELQALYNQGRMAVLANTGVLVKPTLVSDLSDPTFPVPLNLRSHADQVVEMQTAFTGSGGSSGWGGRTLDAVAAANAGTNFPVSIAMNTPALFCAGSVVQGASLQPGNFLGQSAMGVYPPAASQARLTAQQLVIGNDSGNTIVNAANGVMGTALQLNPLLAQAAGSLTFTKKFPQTSIGSQLQEVARIISLNSQLGVSRQVFFCSLGGFDTHGGQPYQQWDLLNQCSQALDAFYAATVQLGVQDQVTAFTLSDFGRTLQPSGSGSDHGWGSHHLVLGGAVSGGRI
ncbi:MAG TPA: DUF1501 domain-containing protein, partial [Acetobacteraceae bacterium]|nr:DUF1501 domain-containing protein [Acetobacteraceae bacterium]